MEQRIRVCPLCEHSSSHILFRDKDRLYYSCMVCRLVFIDPSMFLSRDEEKARYDLHKNSSDDLNYRKFLNHLFRPVSERIKTKSSGLDFGSGPGPTLSKMFEEAGHTMDIYDPFYENNPEVFANKYDFITASEVFEHLHNPKYEISRLWNIIKPGGILGVMTKRLSNLDNFSAWYYKNDPTHVCFYSEETFIWLASELDAEIIYSDNDVILFKKIVTTN